MITEESQVHPTPAGGVRSTIYYLDDDKKPVDKSRATQAEVVEYDRHGKELQRTYASLSPRRR